MKRIWFTQQKPFDYIPLRMGLGYIKATEVYNYKGNDLTLVPKLYTTRTHLLSGEYSVVEGSRFKAKQLNPPINFIVENTALLNLAEGLVCPIHNKKPDYESWACVEILDRNDLSFAELDLGFRGATFQMLQDELLRLNKNVTIDTPFYVNKLEPTKV